MPFKLLKQVISQLRKTSTCPNCSGKFDEDSVFVIATSLSPDNESAHGIFNVFCPKCQGQSFVFVELSKSDSPRGAALRVETKCAPHSGPISMNEILDMHNFLKSWQGDLKDLLKI